MHDPYTALGVDPDASTEEIKKAYRRLARQYHPDTTGGDAAKEQRFKEISQAYDIVGDPEKRAQYDAMHRGRGPGARGGFSAGGDVFDLGDLFSQVFGAGPSPGHVESRVYPGAEGFAQAFEASGFPFPGGHPGTRSRTSERRARSEAKERKIRAHDGSMLVERGGDVYSDARIDFDRAILGAVVEVPTLTGKASVKVPPGTSSGVVLRLKGKGRRRADGRRGDHLVTVQIDVPGNLDEEATKLLVKLMKRVRK